MTLVAVSGGFDPLHVGHVQHLEHAARLGMVVVLLNSDSWLRKKKGFVMFPWEQRKAILKALRWVTDVAPVDDADGTVASSILSLHPTIFAKGGDRTGPERIPPEELMACQQVGCEIRYGISGDVYSSSEIVKQLHHRICVYATS